MSKYQNHQNLLKRFKLLACKQIPGVVIIERHVGKFILIRFITDVLNGKCLLNDWKRYLIAINKPGMADCYALFPSKYGLIHLELEFKSGKSVKSKDQKAWQKAIEKMGGFYLVIRNEKDGVNDILNHLKNKQLI